MLTDVERRLKAELTDAINRCEKFRAALRLFAIKKHVRMVSGGGTIPNGGSCELCKTEWPEGQPEGHRASCLLARSL